MRLKQIKLAGFKSFVDLTKVPFIHQMTAVVGPNGCGKSNIIDAVRWVLGESSAKNLRGDAMTDVIFNGAATRKPVGQASVELIFDNAGKEKLASEESTIAAKMAARTEISIRRVVNRDSVNSYFLNGSKCRRRDITDIFLGTGLGPRSYAIIEQGTISRLIESKPQELRVFIEEAAGVSKYKDRRRETENRIRHTRENLERLNDIRFEIESQIEKLYRQAESAKRFRQLKAEERLLKSQVSAMAWQKFNQKHQVAEQLVLKLKEEATTIIESKSSVSENITSKKLAQIDIEKKQSDLQSNLLSISQSVVRAEQELKHLNTQQNKEADRLADLTAQLSSVRTDLAKTELEQTSLEDKLALEQPKFDDIQQVLNLNQQKLDTTQKELADINIQWQEARKKNDEFRKIRHQLQTEITKKITLQEQLSAREKEIESEFNAISENNNKICISSVKEQGEKLFSELKVDEVQLRKLKDNYALLLENSTELKQKHVRLQIEKEALDKNVKQWRQELTHQQEWQVNQVQLLNEHNIEFSAELYQFLEIDDTWHQAISLVLSYALKAPIVKKGALISSEKFKQILTSQQLNSPIYLLLENVEQSSPPQGTLASLVKNNLASLNYLQSIFIAENHESAFNMLPSLKPHESVICADTTWIGHDFVRQGFIEAPERSVSYKHNIGKAEDEVSAINSQIDLTLEAIACNENDLSTLLEEITILEDKINNSHSSIRANELNDIKIQQQLDYNQQRLSDLTENSITVKTQRKAIEKEINHLQKELNENTGSDNTNVSKLEQQRSALQSKLSEYQVEIQSEQSKHHHISISLEQLKMHAVRARNDFSMFKQQENRLSMSYSECKHTLASMASKDSLDKELEENRKILLTVQSEIETNASMVNDIREEIANIEQNKENYQHQLDEIHERLTDAQLDTENYYVRMEAAKTQLKEQHQILSNVLTELPSHAKENVWQHKLKKVSKEIESLGPINLAAIDEYEEHLDRKNYLDKQNEDLIQAITTLESAIAKIDKESRQKFKSTFDKVNHDLGTLFPKVFGGGSAYLALTDDDLLESGVSIMARPPGKKNSTIHLLSGGEKALTALSLVFAIFRLNPAPFCMLDEVDAPLDDANVERFCNLVREMSQTVQFIYISHNKIAMEMASYLTGVTMFEPGVSRMVSVDIDEAIAMADVS